MSWRSGYFDSEPLTGSDYFFIMLVVGILFGVGRYVYEQYHKENRKLPPLEGHEPKRRTTVDELYPKERDKE